MEIPFKKAPVPSVYKNVCGFVPNLSGRGILAKKINALYNRGLCGGLDALDKKSYVDYDESRVGRLRVLEFKISREGKTLKFCHVYDGLFPWRIKRKQARLLSEKIKLAAERRMGFDESFFANTLQLIEKRLRKATVIPRENGFKVIFDKGVIAYTAQIFNVNF